jgi:hypothetical protein
MDRKMVCAAITIIVIAGCTSPTPDNGTQPPREAEQSLAIETGSELIPIETVTEERGIVTIEYELTEAFSLEQYGQDIMFVFGAALSEHPDSEQIRVITTVGEETILTCTAATQELQELLDGTTEKSVEDSVVCE